MKGIFCNPALLLGLVCLQIHVVSSLKCYQCVNLVTSNSFIGEWPTNEACASETFDPTQVVLQDCGTSFGKTAMCEKWEGKFTIDYFLLQADVSGTVRGCAFLPIGELVDGCVSSTDTNGLSLFSDLLGFLLELFSSISDVEATYCSCERDYCNAAPALSQTAPLVLMIAFLFGQAFVQ
ncbi:uncharacterized protein LOC110982942 [Acanthaster planci]|uniref:Uncharacterized protein LOC110982942 n=1 Tax=Acanthaster planci TaxID=133434 RepID=A0A8B7YVV4_ACAPL|nr:uncharacterized protein LOC110982942 [Acanthaster planci]